MLLQNYARFSDALDGARSRLYSSVYCDIYQRDCFKSCQCQKGFIILLSRAPYRPRWKCRVENNVIGNMTIRLMLISHGLEIKSRVASEASLDTFQVGTWLLRALSACFRREVGRIKRRRCRSSCGLHSVPSLWEGSKKVSSHIHRGEICSRPCSRATVRDKKGTCRLSYICVIQTI